VAQRIAVIGAGWAGLAAAVCAADRGHAVTVFEASRTAGGRARTLQVGMPEGGTVPLDNGQHILIGAYVETLRLMERVGVSPADALLRLPLVLRRPDGSGLALPDWPAPLDAAAGILRARGWTWNDRATLFATAARWQRQGFTCDPTCTVAELAASLTQRVRDELVEPLCVAALNTPSARASGQVFLRVLRDSLFGAGHGRWRGSNLLLPRQELGKLFPDAACGWLAARGHAVHLARRVSALQPQASGWRLDGEPFDRVVLATPPTEAARLVAASGVAAPQWLAATASLAFEPIATVYVTGGPRLSLPMLALHSGPGAPAQFVFDRSQLGGPAGLLAFVASASGTDKEQIERDVLAQALALGWRVRALQTVVEKRATFACVPGLRRPHARIAPGLWACGDYVEGPYPATLEGAVRSAVAVVDAL
jgi:squalene-associated FAD-dependent desaturase